MVARGAMADAAAAAYTWLASLNVVSAATGGCNDGWAAALFYMARARYGSARCLLNSARGDTTAKTYTAPPFRLCRFGSLRSATNICADMQRHIVRA